jgi:PPOX class probable F420-dependent enzyme
MSEVEAEPCSDARAGVGRGAGAIEGGSSHVALQDERYVSLATFRRTGEAVETPVWCAALGGKLYVFSAGDAGKVKRLRNSARARVAACDVRGRVHGDWLEATARILEDPEAIARARAAFRSKYGVQMCLTDLVSRLSGRIRRRAWLEIELG